MPLGKYIQEPGEQIRYTIDYAQWLATGETISTATFAVTPSGGLTIPSDSIGSPATTVSFFATGGTANTKYTVECTATTSAGQIKEDQVVILVREY
jgi:hypothetical protein